ncbi:MAG: STAS domain-containing protein, partial [Beijerinckiaceae bacterium]
MTQTVRSAAGGEPSLAPAADGRRIAFAGDWTMRNGVAAERAVEAVSFSTGQPVAFDLSGLGRLDTLGAMLIGRLKTTAEAAGAAVTLVGGRAEQTLLLSEIQELPPRKPEQRQFTGVDVLEDIGRGMHGIGKDVVGGVSFLGGFIAGVGRLIANPRHFRPAAFVRQLEQIGFRSVPIIALISFL